jgi:hypothetical protein
MKLTQNQISIPVGTGLCGVLAGIAISGGLGSNPAKALVLSGLIATPPSFLAYLVVDGKANERVRKAQRLASDKTLELDKTKTLLTNTQKSNSQLAGELDKLRRQLAALEIDRLNLKGMVESLNPAIEKLQAELITSRKQVEELEAEVAEWESQFHGRLTLGIEEKAKEIRQVETQKVFDEHDAITSEAMRLFRELQGWAVKVSHGHEAKKEIIKSLASTYNENLDELAFSVEKERGHYLEQIELLHEKVGRLQHELNGDLLEPQYGQFGYAVEGKIANDLARRIWEDLQIPLVVKGYQVKPDGCVDVGYGYSRSIQVERLIGDLNRHSGNLAKWLGIHKITAIRKLEIADLLVVTFRREPALKEDTVKLLAGSPEEFITYVTSHPIRYRLISDPGQGKTPSTAVMISEILKVGGTRGNTGKGKKIPHTLVTVSCPDVESSQKDADYPLEIFLKYGNTTTAVKSFSDAYEDWQYRKRDTGYASQFFALWVWDELDVTLTSSSDPLGTGEKLKNLLKQAHHTGMGWIVSGQSVMTKQIPGFMDDDRELFTQIIIGVSKIRKYLEKYGKKILSAKVVNQLLSNLDHLEPYIEDKNSLVTDAARLLRLAFVLDDKSPKLYFLPNLDRVSFDAETIEQTIQKAELAKRSFLAGTTDRRMASDSQDAYTVSIDSKMTVPSNSPIGGSSQSGQKPHCCHCGSSNLNLINDGRYRCLECKKRFVANKVVWK